jgi:uncharacterized oligopeptide transporter (OPT) family protein
MIDLKTKIKLRLKIFGLVVIGGILTSFINSFSKPTLIIVLPGLLFGIALALPHFDRSKRQLITIITLPIAMIILCLFCLVIGLGLGLINNSDNDKTGIIILGITSTLLFLLILDQYFPIVNKKITYLVVIILGVTSLLICDRLFFTPNSKELNIGKMICIWEILVGFGLMFFGRFNWMSE